MREDTAHSNAMQMVEIENLYARRRGMLTSIFLEKNYGKLSPLQVINRFKYVKMEIHH